MIEIERYGHPILDFIEQGNSGATRLAETPR
jgi:hypothetical protein